MERVTIPSRLPHPSPARSVEDEVRRLRMQVNRAQVRRLEPPALPAHPGIGGLLRGGGLRPGSVYSISSSTSLLFAMLAAPSRAGTWCAVIGMPELGVEAAERAGIDLSRVVLVPEPGARWIAVAATIAEVLPIVVLRPTGRAGGAETARMAARLRERGAVLLVVGPWPQADAVLSTSAPRWSGLGQGHGHLTEREVTVTVTSRRDPTARTARMLLPGPAGAPLPASHPVADLERAVV